MEKWKFLSQVFFFTFALSMAWMLFEEKRLIFEQFNNVGDVMIHINPSEE